jgi:hypothetical protein
MKKPAVAAGFFMDVINPSGHHPSNVGTGVLAKVLCQLLMG